MRSDLSSDSTMKDDEVQEECRMQKVGIICAGDEELKPFLSHIKNFTVTEKSMLKFYEGSINGVSVVALFSGVCKVNAAIATQILIDTFCVGSVINAGTAGGMDESIDIFDIVVATQVAYHDVDDAILTQFHPYLSSIYFDTDKNFLNIAERISMKIPKVNFGKMVTGERFIENHMRDDNNQKFMPLSVDMESASIAHVCYVNQIPFISIRCITDTGTHSGIGKFEENCLQASIIAKEFVIEFLIELQKKHNDKNNNKEVLVNSNIDINLHG